MNHLKRYINGDKFFQSVINTILFLFLLLELYPLLYVISASFSDVDAVNAGKLVLWPVGFNVEGYEFVFQYRDIWIGYANTIFYTVVGTLLNLAVTLPCAYALSCQEVVGKNKIMIFFMITMYIGGGLVPNYLNMKSFGLIDTRAVLIIVGALSVYNMIVARTFFATSIPNELKEAAKIDGSNDFGIFARIVMPLSKAITAVMVLYYGVAHWNAYFSAMIYLDDRSKYPLQMILREILLQSKLVEELATSSSLTEAEALMYEALADAAELVKYCTIVIASLPMMIIYPKLQKFFEKGVMIGSIKG